MARRRLIWHLGLAQPPRAVVGANLYSNRSALAQSGALVTATAEESALATHEILRTHKAAGLSRTEVEGQWARICDRIWKHKGVSLLSTPDLCAADKDQIRLALDPLIGIEVHLVVTLDSFSQQLYGGWLAELRAGRTTGWDKYVGRVVAGVDPAEREHRQAEDFWAGHELDAMLGRWGWTLHPERVHVIAQTGVAEQWFAFLDIAGVTDAVPPVVPPYADPAGVAVLRKVNRQLDERLPSGSVDLLNGVDDESAAMPVVATPALDSLLERWHSSLVEGRYDVRGALDVLRDAGVPTGLPGPRDQLSTAVDVLAEALAENARLRTVAATLEADRDRLDRKRRKLKRRLRQVASEN